MKNMYSILNRNFHLHLKCNTWSAKDTLSKTTRKVFKLDQKKIKQKFKSKQQFCKPETFAVKIGPRLNSINMQMLSANLYNQVFKGYATSECRERVLQNSLQSLRKHEIDMQNLNLIDDVDFVIPPLEGDTLEEHFRIIGEKQAHPYMSLLDSLINNKLPSKPKIWVMQKGWTKYTPGERPEKVDFPDENALFFDVEVCVSLGKVPTMAAAVGTKAWYSWASDQLMFAISNPANKHRYPTKILIPLESSPDCCGVNLSQHFLQPKIIIGHNVSYDRSKVKEQYWLEKTGLRFFDTMAMHISINGLTSYQRAILKSGKVSVNNENWAENSSLNSLKDIYKLYCNNELKKDFREMFITGTIQEIYENFQILMEYCSCDVEATYEVFCKIYPIFLERFPHPVTFAGMLELSTAYLPINSNWDRYINNSEQTFQDLHDESTYLLSRRAEQACQMLTNEQYKNDLWMWDQDWDVKNLKLLKYPRQSHEKLELNSDHSSAIARNDDISEDTDMLTALNDKFNHLHKMHLYSRPSLLPGYPNWYKKLCIKSDQLNWVPGVYNISTSLQITPKLLSLTWEGFPLHYIRGLGWGFLVPFTKNCDNIKIPIQALTEKCSMLKINQKSNNDDTILDNRATYVQEVVSDKVHCNEISDINHGVYSGSGIWCDTILENCVFFMRLPHKDGINNRVGNPLAKDFLTKFSQNVLAGNNKSVEHVIDIARQLSYWRNNRDRIRDQMVVLLDQKDVPENLRDQDYTYGAIIPQIVVSGTLTRRAVEATWMTASNANEQRIGSELRAMVQAPTGYSIIGADVDSQELWIASVIGDASFAKVHGATPLGWMTLSGTKAHDTDMHSVTAKAVGISREHAKVINYARIYGAGQHFADRLLKQFNPSISTSEARRKSIKMFEMTKGKRKFRLKNEFLDILPDKDYNKWQACDIAKAHNKKFEDMFTIGQWKGGSESAMFNKLEEIANNVKPVTPFLGCRLSRALEPHEESDMVDRFLPTRINWVVQSSAVDFLHLVLVCMHWILKERARFCLSFHDEVRYLVADEHKYKAALAMHTTNLLTRSFCSLRLGIADLPQSVAFFESVEVDTVLRKEAQSDCKTPSNPHGLLHGYNIANGENLDIQNAILRAHGRKADWFL